ncbi:magnesium transporter [bacterium]|nr:magnesium transporter [bacterium]
MDEIHLKTSFADIISDNIEGGRLNKVRALVDDLHPADIAEAIDRLDPDYGLQVFGYLETETAAEVLIELDESVRQRIVAPLTEELLVAIIAEMDSDDAADVLYELDEKRQQLILAAMPGKDQREVRTLLRHDEESAGGLMALEIVAVNQHRTAEEALEVLRRKSDEIDDVYNIYAVDSRGHLRGAVSLKDVVLAEPKTKLLELIEDDVIAIRPEMDQEEVAHLFQKYDLVAAPVVDENNKLVGRITVDDVLDVVEEEASEDMSMMAGITDEAIRERSIFRRAWVRLPWLLVAFAGEMVSALIMSSFSDRIEFIITSAFFIPLIMAMGGNTGIQSATIVIRGLATGEFNTSDTKKRLFSELSVALFNGLIIGLLVMGVVTAWLHTWKLGLVLSGALIAVIINATLMGTLIPFVLKRFKIDPAVATGPFITTSNDILGLLIYFSMIFIFKGWLQS